MASTTTFRGAVNSVLRAVNSPSVSATDFATPDGANNAKEIRQAKEIVLEVFNELQNDRPDSFWQKSVEFLVYKPYNAGAITTIPASPNNTTITFNSSASLDSIPWITGSDPVTVDDTLLHVYGERQYYRVKERTSNTVLELFQGIIEKQGFNDVDNPLAYAVFKYRYDLAADFRDVLNVFNPYVGADLIPVGAERMFELISEYAYLVTTQGADTGWGTDPTHYAILRDDSGSKNIMVHPIPTQNRVLTIRYQRNQTVPSAESDTFDLDEDYMPILLSRAKGRACMEIVQNPDGARYYHMIEAEQKERAKTKSMEQGSGNQKLIPSTGMDYRAHYRETEQEDYNRRLWLRR